jgi:hypothetical protein
MDYLEQCPCCGYLTLGSRGAYEIRPVCYWEDDNATEVFGQDAPHRPQGPNHVQLWQARQNFQAFGAAEEKDKQWTRPPRPDERTARRH